MEIEKKNLLYQPSSKYLKETIATADSCETSKYN